MSGRTYVHRTRTAREETTTVPKYEHAWGMHAWAHGNSSCRDNTPMSVELSTVEGRMQCSRRRQEGGFLPACGPRMSPRPARAGMLAGGGSSISKTGGSGMRAPSSADAQCQHSASSRKYMVPGLSWQRLGASSLARALERLPSHDRDAWPGTRAPFG